MNLHDKYFSGRVIFDHLPKTAGQAIGAWLRSELGSGVVTMPLNGNHRTLIHRFGGEFAVICAHIQFAAEGLNPLYQYLTCIREPIDRATSWLFYLVNNHTSAKIGSLWGEACRFLESEGEEMGDVLKDSCINPYANHFASVSAKVYGSDGALLTAALAVIDHYEVCGLYEDIPGFMLNVSALLGLGVPMTLPRVNVTTARPSLVGSSPKLLRRLREWNEVDLELYSILHKRWQIGQQKPKVSLPAVSHWKPCNVQRDREFNSPEFTLLSANCVGAFVVQAQQVITFDLVFSLAMPTAELEIGIHITDEDGHLAFGTNTSLLNRMLINVKPGTHCLQYHLVVALPEGTYNAGFAFVARDAQRSRELAWFDKLLDFSVTIPRLQACVGYASMPVVVTCLQTSEAISSLVEDAAGSLRVVGVLDAVTPDEVFFMSVVLENASTQTWGTLYAHPLSLSYHWQDSVGNNVVLDGERTLLPVNLVLPGESLTMTMTVRAPPQPGDYQLVLLPVQEHHGWFDQFGFTPAVSSVCVLPNATTRRYLGNDARLSTQCGMRYKTALLTTGQEGFFIYGPYVEVLANHYVVRMSVTVNGDLAGAWLEVCGESGAQRFAWLDLALIPAQSTEVVLPFELDKNCDDLEMRLWVPAGADLLLRSLLIESND